ncbi:type II toxin-antitoxin system HicA family toxin [Pelistega suis]|uniref:Addiction module toxin, HicA family n=1 Tax=Pelistega suis TaxID=1631957 RepID=A0A849P696_9BURK|nr:type II toxin-antitoxin system HicA family toxin [Pelistega suis]NOL52121.1 addiction module toxin, HicA family [Pelistega suis]
MKSRDLIELLKKNGWFLVRVSGSHHQFKHGLMKGTVTVPHPKEHIPVGTLNSVLKAAKLK